MGCKQGVVSMLFWKKVPETIAIFSPKHHANFQYAVTPPSPTLICIETHLVSTDKCIDWCHLQRCETIEQMHKKGTLLIYQKLTTRSDCQVTNCYQTISAHELSETVPAWQYLRTEALPFILPARELHSPITRCANVFLALHIMVWNYVLGHRPTCRLLIRCIRLMFATKFSEAGVDRLIGCLNCPTAEMFAGHLNYF